MSANSIYQPTIHDLPEDERPRERLKYHGAAALSNTELLAILLRTGTKGENVLNLSSRLLAEKKGLPGLLKASISDLANIKGVGLAKACQLKAALELGRRLMIAAPHQKPQITCPADAANLFMVEMGSLEQEHLRLLVLDTKNYILSSPVVYKGNVNTSIIRVGELFRYALKENATAIILMHNHPSGDPTPSPEDVHVTERIVKAGKMLDIDILDHIIIGQQRFVSLKERGVAF
jgi:DNA repair protein RadC